MGQGEIWDRVVVEAKRGGMVGIHFDEAQHIFRKKSYEDRLGILDDFDEMMKSHDWPMKLIFSGVPELDGYLRLEPQLYHLLNRIEFPDITLPKDYDAVHEIVGSYAMKSELAAGGDVLNDGSYHRWFAAGAFR